MKRRGVLGLVVVLVLVLVMASAAQAAGPGKGHTFPHLSYTWNGLFTKIAGSGFGDQMGNVPYFRHNNYAWSMEEFNGDLYVGTGRSVTTFNIMWEMLWRAMEPGVRPPELPDVDHPPFLQDFLSNAGGIYRVIDEAGLRDWVSHSQAEIWRFRDGEWEQVYQSPLVPSLLRDETGAYPDPRYQVAKTSGFRGMINFTDSHGVAALYAAAGGLSLAVLTEQQMLYRTTNGTDWTPLATPAPMGVETRALAVLNGKLYVGVGGGDSLLSASPSVWCSSDPAGGAGTWTKVLDFPTLDSTNLDVPCLCAFNGYLYAGTQNRNGFQIWRSTTGSPASNADWVKVVTDGAGDRYNMNCQTMKPFNGALYVGTVSLPFLSGYSEMKGFEIIRIWPGDWWQLVMGAYDPVDAPTPADEDRVPISGWPAGFGNPMAFYGWSMEVYDGYLFCGNLDTSVFLRYLDDYEGELPDIPNLAALIAASEQISGCDLWCTGNGQFWLPVTIDGFDNPENYGFRTIKATSMGLFLGTANPFTGFEIYRSNY